MYMYKMLTLLFSMNMFSNNCNIIQQKLLTVPTPKTLRLFRFLYSGACVIRARSLFKTIMNNAVLSR